MSDLLLSVAGIAGSPSASSRSRTLLSLALDEYASHGATTTLIDLGQLPADALLGRAESPVLDSARADVAAARLVIVSTPVYRATYSGLLKVFFDLLPIGALDGKVCAGIATGGSPAHASVLEYGLRPLLSSLDGIVPFSGLHALDTHFIDDVPSERLRARLSQLVLNTLTQAAADRTIAGAATVQEA